MANSNSDVSSTAGGGAVESFSKEDRLSKYAEIANDFFFILVGRCDGDIWRRRASSLSLSVS